MKKAIPDWLNDLSDARHELSIFMSEIEKYGGYSIDTAFKMLLKVNILLVDLEKDLLEKTYEENLQKLID